MAKRRIERRLVRVQQDAVSGELRRTVMDPAQEAFERANRVIENAVSALAVGDTLGALAVVMNARMHLILLEQDDLPPAEYREPLLTVSREWKRLDAPGRTKFAGLLREWLKRMAPHRDSDLNQGEVA